jgi:1-deoxy-D-xylulose-5-phosphate reductoisomerase
MENVVILGSTGSVGKQALEVISAYPDKFKVFGIAAKSNITDLKIQIERFRPEIISVQEKEAFEILANSAKGVYLGEEGLIKLSSHPQVDIVLICTSGTAALSALFAAISAKKKIIQANKEIIIAGGEIINKELRRHNVSIIPIDSEHSAIFQCLKGEEKRDVKRIILTCSGGPFRNHSLQSLERVSKEEAPSHPVWKMGPKISIDSATLMNKGFEIIEAHYLFDIPLEKIDVVIHPEGVIHSMVEFNDGNIKAILGPPSMKGPIEYALFYPERGSGTIPGLNLSEVEKLSFFTPDTERFPCLEIARDALRTGGTMPAALVFADEIVVKKFLDGEIKFLDIPKVIKEIIDGHKKIANPKMEDIVSLEKEIKNLYK